MATDGSLKGAPGKNSAIGYGIAKQCFDHEDEPPHGENGTECPRSMNCCEVFALRKALKKRVAVTILTHNLEVGEVQCTWDRNPNTGEWKKINEALRKFEAQGGLEKQLVARHVTAPVTSESRRQMKNKVKFNTEGNDKDRRMGKKERADMDRESGAEWPASALQSVTGKS